MPEFQHVAVGDLICDGPYDYASYFRFEPVDPPRSLVYRWIRHRRRGSPIDIDDPESSARVEQELLAGGTFVDFTWALALNPLPGDRTRLLVRTRANYAPPVFGLLVLPLGIIDATYGVAMLRAIARRAETTKSADTRRRVGSAGGTCHDSETVIRYDAQRPLETAAPRRVAEPRFKLRGCLKTDP